MRSAATLVKVLSGSKRRRTGTRGRTHKAGEKDEGDGGLRDKLGADEGDKGDEEIDGDEGDERDERDERDEEVDEDGDEGEEGDDGWGEKVIGLYEERMRSESGRMVKLAHAAATGSYPLGLWKPLHWDGWETLGEEGGGGVDAVEGGIIAGPTGMKSSNGTV